MSATSVFRSQTLTFPYGSADDSFEYLSAIVGSGRITATSTGRATGILHRNQDSIPYGAKSAGSS